MDTIDNARWKTVVLVGLGGGMWFSFFVAWVLGS